MAVDTRRKACGKACNSLLVVPPLVPTLDTVEDDGVFVLAGYFCAERACSANLGHVCFVAVQGGTGRVRARVITKPEQHIRHPPLLSVAEPVESTNDEACPQMNAQRALARIDRYMASLAVRTRRRRRCTAAAAAAVPPNTTPPRPRTVQSPACTHARLSTYPGVSLAADMAVVGA